MRITRRQFLIGAGTAGAGALAVIGLSNGLTVGLRPGVRLSGSRSSGVTPTAIYDFEADTVGEAPSGITAVAGTFWVVNQATLGKSLQPQTDGENPVAESRLAIATFDAVSAEATDIIVIYKHLWPAGYDRNGVMVRFDAAAGTGYLLQVNESDARIYRCDGGVVTLLASEALAQSGSGVPRWYKVEAQGSALSLSYSDDGETYTEVVAASDSTYQNGTVAYSAGWAHGDETRNYVDDVSITFTVPGTSSLTITSPVAYQTYQRDGSDQADIAISGTYVGTPSAIEARFNGGPWATIDASPSGGTYSGTLSAQAAGQGTLEVRFVDAPDVTASVDNVGIGDVFVIGGQSNASGRGNNNQSYSHATLKATLFGNDYAWQELTDPTDSNSGQVDTVSDDSAAGSCWPLLATQIMAATGYPVAFVPAPKGGTSIAQWQPGVDHQDRSTLYGSMVYRANQVGTVKAVLWWQGERDAVLGTAEATYNSGLDTVANAVNADLSCSLVVCKIADLSTYNTGYDETAVNNAIATAWSDNANVVAGPDFSDITPSVDGVHFKTDQELQAAADRWFAALQAAGIVGGGGGQPAPSLDPDAQTLIDAMTVTPDGARQTLISDTIVALKNAGIWSLLDECWFLAAHDAQAALLGWKRYKDCTAVNAPTFEADRGFAGDGATSYLDTGFVPSTDGVNYTLNNASLGAYIRTDIATNNTADIGARTVSDDTFINSRNNGGDFNARIHSVSSINIATSDSFGLHSAQRTGANAAQLFRNGVQVTSATVNVPALPTVSFYICALHQSDGPSHFTQRQIAFAFVAAAMSEQQQAGLYTVVQDYMTAIGAAV